MADNYGAGGAGGAFPMDTLDPTAFGASSPDLPLPDDSRLAPEPFVNRFAPEPYRRRAPAAVAPMVPSASDPFGLGLSGGLPTPSAPLVLDLQSMPTAAPAAVPAPARPTAAMPLPVRALQAAQRRETAPALPAGLAPDVTGYAGPEHDARLAEQAALYQETGGRQGIAPSTFQAAQQARQQYRVRNPDVAFVEDVQKGRAQTEATVGGIAVQQELAQAELAQREADIEKQRQKFAYEEFEAAKARAKEQQDALRFAETEMDTLNQEVRETKIDPNAYWTNQNAFGKALSAISVALGAFAQGYSGGRVPNTALQLMNAAIEREIDAQKANLANKRASLADKRSVYAMARQRFGDAEQAENYTRARLQEALGATVSQYRGEARTEQLRLGGEKLTAEISQKVREYDNVTRDAYVKREMEQREAERRRRAAAEAYAAGAEERRLKKERSQLELKKLGLEVEEKAYKQAAMLPSEGGWQKADAEGKPLEQRYVPNLGGLASSPEDAKKLREVTSQRAQVQSELSALARGIKDNTLSTQQVDSRVLDLMPQISVLHGQGAMADAERDAMQQALGRGWFARKFGTAPNPKILEDFAKRIAQGTQQIGSGYGVVPVEQKTQNGMQVFRATQTPDKPSGALGFKPLPGNK